MMKETEMKRVPKLRFPEFTDDWEQRKVTEIGNIVTGSTPKTSIVENYGGEFLFISPADIQGNRYINETVTTLTQKGFSQGRKIRKKASLFVSIGSTIGKVAQTTRESTTNQQINAVEPYDDFDDDFIFTSLENVSGNIKAIASNQAVPIVNKTTFGEVELAVPSDLNEQKAIGEFFFTLDHLITLHQRKLEKLKELRKGVMKKLFSQEVRFKADDGSEFSEWEKKKIGDVFSKIKDKNKDGRNQNVITNSAEFGLINQRDFFDKDIAVDGKTENYTVIKTGDFVYNPRKSKQAPYGPFNCYKLEENGIVSPLYTCLRPKSNVNDKYFLWYFKSGSWYRFIYENGAQNGARHDRVGMTDFLMQEIPVYLPQAVEEQQKIAECLSALDDVIEKQKATLAAWEELKKGLLQQMFV